MEKTKPFTIPKELFVQAYKLVRANAGAAGIDEQSLEDFNRKTEDPMIFLSSCAILASKSRINLQ